MLLKAGVIIKSFISLEKCSKRIGASQTEAIMTNLIPLILEKEKQLVKEDKCVSIIFDGLVNSGQVCHCQYSSVFQISLLAKQYDWRRGK